MDINELLDRYALVGGPEDMIPHLREVARIINSDPEVSREYDRETEALFVSTPGVNIASWTTVPDLGEHTGAFNMAVALACVPAVAATHRKYGLPESHLAHTFSWFRPMIEMYRRRHGVPGITHTRTFWFRFHVDGTLFRFGSMEFLRGPVPDYIPEEFRLSLKEGDEVPSFHFPGGENGLDEDRIRESFAMANCFWKEAFGHYPKAWACDSWLFSEYWQQLIPHSRIARSIDLYDRLPSLPYNPEEPSGLFFVYDSEVCDPRDYPVTNSLEKAFVTLFEKGIPLRDGCAWVRVSPDGETLFRK